MQVNHSSPMTEGERAAQLAWEYTEMSMEIRELEKLIEETEKSPRFPEDPEFLIPYMEREIQKLRRQREYKMQQIRGEA